MSASNDGSFKVGDWLVEPARDQISRDSESTYLRPQVMELLVYLARQKGRVVSAEVLLDDLWAGKIVTDGTVYNCVAELRHALAGGDDQHTHIETIPKKGYRLLAPVTVLDDSPEPIDGTGHKLEFAIIGVLAIAVVYVVAERFFWADNRAPDPQVNASIAVLPFMPLSSGEDDSFFADGLTEEIRNDLAQLPELQVAGRSSSVFFKGQNIPAPEIGARLNVAHIVEGSVRRDGERVRITAQLIRASDGFHLWSDSYDRTLEDVLAVQEDIAENIAEALDVVFDDNARRLIRSAGTRDVGAYIDYMKGQDAYAMAHAQAFTSELLAIANGYFDRALEAAPGLTNARLLKADLASHILIDIGAGFRDEEYSGEARETLAALREEYDLAWRVSPSGNSRDILDLERTLFSEDWSRLPARIRKAMQPGSCPITNWTRTFITPFGWAEQTAAKNREILACDPMNWGANYTLPLSLIWAGNPEAALHAVEEAENKGLSYPRLEDSRYWALLAAGRASYQTVHGPGPKGSDLQFPRQILREALAGDSAVAREMAQEHWSRPDVDHFSSLVVAAVVGDRERANELAARIDASPGSAVALAKILYTCFCGAPFDLEATPNYKARIEEADFPWPPPKRIDYPTKTW